LDDPFFSFSVPILRFSFLSETYRHNAAQTSFDNKLTQSLPVVF